MTPTDWMVKSLQTVRNIFVCLFSDTFPRSPKRDGTATERRHRLYCGTGNLHKKARQRVYRKTERMMTDGSSQLGHLGCALPLLVTSQ